MPSSDYNYDDQGQFFPFFMLTMVGLITVPLTYNVLKPSTDLEQTATRIKSDFKPKNDDLIEAQRRRRKRKNRKTKRIIAVILGYSFMAYMVYLIVVAQRTVPKLWDPYDILGVSRVRDHQRLGELFVRLIIYRAHQSPISTSSTKDCRSNSTLTKRNLIPPKMKPWKISTTDGSR